MSNKTQKIAAIADTMIAGALFDLMGFLTTSETQYKFSAYDEASPAVRVLEAFAAKRGLTLADADVANWSDQRASIADLEAKLVAAEDAANAAKISFDICSHSLAAAEARKIPDLSEIISYGIDENGELQLLFGGPYLDRVSVEHVLSLRNQRAIPVQAGMLTDERIIDIAAQNEYGWSSTDGEICPYSVNEEEGQMMIRLCRAILAASATDHDAQQDCGACHGSGWVVRDPDIGTEQECFSCDGSGKDEEAKPDHDALAKDAARYREIRSTTGAAAVQCFHGVPTPQFIFNVKHGQNVNLLKGSVAGHLDDSLDAAIAARKST